LGSSVGKEFEYTAAARRRGSHWVEWNGQYFIAWFLYGGGGVDFSFIGSPAEGAFL
jgi:hypothetical protein